MTDGGGKDKLAKDGLLTVTKHLVEFSPHDSDYQRAPVTKD